jgi:plastocyanin
MLTACTKSEQVGQAPPKELVTVDYANGATISGVIRFDGTAPKPTKIDMSYDPACKGQQYAEPVAVTNGNLANVFVYVKDGLGDKTFAPPQPPVEIDQKGCRYEPHVVGVMTGQQVKIVNADSTMHNTHPLPAKNHEWNAAQMPGAEPMLKTFANQETMIPVKCNQHPWMKMYVNVVPHPFFAVTGKDGQFEIKGLPPGTYTIAAVQEKLGEQTQQITVAARATSQLQFVFGHGVAAAAAK